MALSPFESYVNAELPIRIVSLDDATAIEEGMIPVSTGMGLATKFFKVEDVLAGAKSAYDLAVENGFQGTIEEWLESLKGEDGVIGIDGKSAYDIAVEAGFQGSETEWLESLKGEPGADGSDLTADQLQELLNERGYTVEKLLRVLGKNGAVVSNAAFVNFLMIFDKRIDNENLGSSDKIPQRMFEAGRMEAEGYSYFKNSPATTNDPNGPLDETPEAELRVYDSGKLQFGSLDNFIEFGVDENISVTKDGVTTEYALGSGGSGVSGAVFITDVKPIDPNQNTGDKEMSEDGYSLVNFSATTNFVTVEFTAITGHSNFKPNVLVNGEVPTLTQNSDAPLWNGTIDLEVEINDDNQIVIEVVHEDGAKAVTVGQLDEAPEIEFVTFTSEYPSGQTELKENDEMDIQIVTNGPVVAYEVDNFGAFKSASGNVNNLSDFEVKKLKIANRGNVTTNQGFKVRVQKASGAWSNWFESSVESGTELESFVKLNNLKPTITITEIEYPEEQFAIKAGESVTLRHVINNADSYQYSSNGQLDIPQPTVYASDKVINYASGDYNDNIDNLTIFARKASNGATSEVKQVVRISNVAPTVTLGVPAARLRSGGNHGTTVQKHTITLTSNQMLVKPPQLNAPEGNWETNDWRPNANRKVWTRDLLVHDDDAKGQFNFNSPVAVSGSGLETNEITGSDSYTLGGFVFRTLSVAAYPNRQTDIGTEVVNTSKLRCTNLSKGGSGTLNFTYKDNDDNEVDTYTIKDGNIWYNCDAANSTSNTSGLMKIELEEVV